jgi:hypothetical protein
MTTHRNQAVQVTGLSARSVAPWLRKPRRVARSGVYAGQLQCSEAVRSWEGLISNSG